MEPINKDLLTGIQALIKPDYHKLNEHNGRNDRLLHACLCAYAKHSLDCDDIGWGQLGDILHSALRNEFDKLEEIYKGENLDALETWCCEIEAK